MWMLVWMAGCSPVGVPEVIRLADPERTGAEGADGPLGAAVVSLAAQGRVTEVVPVDVVYPTDDGTDPAVQDAPVVVFVHGGLVSPERYHWVGAHLATRGFVTVMPRAALDLAITQPGNGALALAGLRRAASREGVLDGIVEDDGPVAAAGHSLGGVMAARQWVRDPEVDLLVMMASFPAGADPVGAQGDRPVVAISGTTDRSLTVDEFLSASDAFVDPAVYLVTGLNHYGWTDDATDGELAGDGPLQGPLDDLRRAAMGVVDAWLDVALTDADPARLDGPFDGVEAP